MDFFIPEEVGTTLLGILVMAIMGLGAYTFNFPELSTLIQILFFAGFGLGVYLISPTNVRKYFKTVKKIEDKIRGKKTTTPMQ